MKKDKILHFAFSLAIVYGASIGIDIVFDSPVWSKVFGFAIGIGAGIFKEVVIDKEIQWGDVYADIAGCVLGVILAILIPMK